jgi:MAF protein
MPPLILASSSPRRKDLLALSGLPFIIFPANVDESPEEGEDPQACVVRLAELKMRAALELSNRMGFSHDQIVLSSDTIVVFEGAILGKPLDAADATRMLRLLRGKTHQVMTAISLARVDSSEIVQDLCVSDVPMRDYSDEEIEAYVATGDPLDKAGAYAIQSKDFHPVETFSHCFASVMGLPLCHVTRSLTKMQIKIFEDIPVVCQHSLNYTCPVYAAILEDSGSK